MKPHIKFALVICCAAISPLLSSKAATVQVRVGAGGLRFNPQNVTIQAGDTVQWSWVASGHSSTSGTPGNPDGIWDSGVQNSGFVFSHTFSTAGTFPYYCTPHGACCGMIGSVTVGTPPPPVGAVFFNANSTNNEVWMYSRADNGQLTSLGTFSTQGTGSGNGLSSQGSIALNGTHEFLYVVNAASSDITAFRVESNGLTFLGKVPSGGLFPSSVTTFGNFLYVLNAKGTAANISGFTIQTDGSLVAIPNSTRPLSVASPSPAQVSFTPDGTTLVVTEKSSKKIDTYAVSGDGTTTGPLVQVSAGPGPFGFAFDGAGHLIVSEVNNSSASSYTISAGVLQVVTAQLRDFGRAACWAACTGDPTLPQQYCYVSNTKSDTVSGFAVAADGSLSLLNPDGKTAVLTRGAFPIDLVVTSDNKYLYVLEPRLPGIGAFGIQSDGSLVHIQDIRRIPGSSYGITGF